MIAAIPSATILGARGQRVVVEVHAGPGLPSFQMIGMPDETCREARDRVRAALLCAGLSWPSKRLTVNLSPPGQRKVGCDRTVQSAKLLYFGSIQGFAPFMGIDQKLKTFPVFFAQADEFVHVHRLVRLCLTTFT